MGSLDPCPAESCATNISEPVPVTSKSDLIKMSDIILEIKCFIAQLNEINVKI